MYYIRRKKTWLMGPGVGHIIIDKHKVIKPVDGRGLSPKINWKERKEQENPSWFLKEKTRNEQGFINCSFWSFSFPSFVTLFYIFRLMFDPFLLTSYLLWVIIGTIYFWLNFSSYFFYSSVKYFVLYICRYVYSFVHLYNYYILWRTTL